ncbi:MAG: hypothetical protein HZA36_03405 [Parcubacteria group bacterium]|nr:hypothetical protein [Parcubacteria group bacterium]
MSEYKQHSGVRRVPLGILRVRRPHRPYLTEEEFQRLLNGEVLIEEKVDGAPYVREESGYVFYCEDLKYQHSIAYNRIPRSQGEFPSFVVCYDVWIMDEARWADRREKEYLCEAVGVPVIPLVFRGMITTSEIPVIANRISAFGEECIEGLVIKNYGTDVFGKFINAEFISALEDAEHWRNRPLVVNILVFV